MSIDFFAHLNSSVASACLILDLILAALYYGKILVDFIIPFSILPSDDISKRV